MTKSFLLLSFIFLLKISFAQNLSSIQGKVIDAKTKKPLLSAVVFLANTAIGVYADENGAFMLDKIPSGKYDLTCSMLGYKTLSIPIQFSGNTFNDYLITLEPSSTLLDQVTVVSHLKKQNRYDYSKFLKCFLGQTANAGKCRILNLEDIVVYEEERKLKALAKKPIVIENKALGYMIHYELKEFVFDPVLRQITFSGIPRFEELPPLNIKQEQKWVKERDRAFYGSTQHFLISLKHGKLSSNDYQIRNTDGVFLDTKDVLKDSLFYYRTKIYISFYKELPEVYYPLKSNEQESGIIFTGAPIKIYENGYFEDFHSAIFEGYIGWSSSVAELMPFGYQPAHH